MKQILQTLLILLAPMILITTSARAEWSRENPGMPEKMCWAHFCGWGFNVLEMFDQPESKVRLYDRTLLGKHVGTDLGTYSSIRDQIRTALEYGINGFCVDIPRLDGYLSLGRLYQAAEGLPFKVALCVDGWPGEIAEVVDALSVFFDTYGRHPNTALIDGRPVAFIYRTDRPIEECREILRLLAERGHRPYWLVQPQGENTLWADAPVMEEHLDLFDGLYDFGINGFPLDKMIHRLANGRQALETKRPEGVLCAGLSQGYLGPHNGFYRPYLGTGTFRNNWEAALSSHADWVCLTTWNDYIETTHFEPAVWGRDSMLRINAEYLRQWRNEPMPNRPPRVIVSYREETRLGDDVTIEVLHLPYSTPASQCHVRVLNESGAELTSFPPALLSNENLQAQVLRLNAPGLSGDRLLRVQATVTDVSERPAAEEWLELYPIILRPGTLRAQRTLRINLNDVLDTPSISVDSDNSSTKITASFPSWAWWGRADLIRNGIELQTTEIAKFGPEVTEVGFAVTEDDQRTPEDVYVIRFQRHDWKVAYTPPVLVKRPVTGLEPDVTLPVIVRGADSDESWGNNPWNVSWRLQQSVLAPTIIPPHEVFQIYLPMDRDTGEYCADAGGWTVAGQRGNASQWGLAQDELQPQWVLTEGPTGDTRICLRFDGVDDNVTFPFHTLPHGPMTVEIRVRLVSVGRPMTVFSDQNGAFTLAIDASGRPMFTRLDVTCQGEELLRPGQWYHLAGVYDGSSLAIIVNGGLSGAIAAPPTICATNSRPVVGALVQEGMPQERYLAADLAGFALCARPLTSSELLLLGRE